MVMSTQALPRFSIDEYLKLERAAETRSEYLQGTIVAMAGASRNHNWLASETLVRLGEQLRGRTCGVAGSDVRLYIPKYEVLTYPDVVVTCGPDVYIDGEKDTITDATFIVEVLSPSTQNYDRGEKFRYYRGMPSFAEYLLLSQDAIRAEHHVRQPDGSWVFREIADANALIELSSIGCQLPLGDLYARVQFENA
jgi:Uma2 family endonuclease